jgi:hypothetical protein
VKFSDGIKVSEFFCLNRSWFKMSAISGSTTETGFEMSAWAVADNAYVLALAEAKEGRAQRNEAANMTISDARETVLGAFVGSSFFFFGDDTYGRISRGARGFA